MTLQSGLSACPPVDALFEAMNTKNPAMLEPFLCDDVRFDFPGAGLISGKKKVLVFLKVLLRKYPDLSFEVQQVLVDGEAACVVWTNSARRETSQPYRNSGVTIIHCAHNRITFISDYFKDTSFVNGPA